MQYPDSVHFLYSLGNETKSIKFGLEGIRTILERIGNPQERFRSVHVAGTNGKGSTCAMIEAGLRAAGMKTGLYTSPHLIEPTERIQIDGVPITTEQFSTAFTIVHEAARTMENHPTYFETVTAMGFLVFAEAQVDIAVVEVGLGGRLDATNTLQPELCVITPVDYDHEQWLGSSLEAIAGEKAGILKPGVPVVISEQRSEALAVICRHADDLGCRVIQANGSFKLPCGLAGAHQAKNAATAAAVLEQMGVNQGAIECGISGVRWPGRLEVVARDPEILLDGAHNPAGARALASYILQTYAGRTKRLIYGAMRDKSVEEITEILFPLFDDVILTAPNMPRAVRPEALAESSDHPRIRTAPNIREAVELARAGVSDAVVVVTGSLYLVGEARGLLVK